MAKFDKHPLDLRAYAGLGMTAFSVITSVRVSIDPATAFARIAAIDLPRAFVGYGPLPAVIGIEGTSVWQSVGQRRTLRLADGSSAVETLTSIETPSQFAYRVDRYSSILRLLVDHAQAQWRFVDDADSGGCQMIWQYRYVPRHWLAAPLVWLITHTLWRGYMRRSIDRCAAIVRG